MSVRAMLGDMDLPVLLGQSDGPLVLAVLGLIVAALVIIIELVRNESRRKAWAAIATRLGLARIGRDHLVGELAGSQVEADIFAKGTGKNRRWYTRIRAQGELPENLDLGREGFFSKLFGDDIETGDPEFDKAVRVKGEAGVALALLDPVMRAVALDAVLRGWGFRGGTWIYQRQGRLGAKIEPLLEEAARLAGRVREAAQAIGPRLVERVRRDPNPGVRARCLAYLIARFPSSNALKAALAAAVSDKEARIRLDAAKYLGDVGKLAALAVDRSVAPELRAEALSTFTSHGQEPDAISAVAKIGRERDEGGMGLELRAALAEALGSVPWPDAERALIALLDDAEEPVRLSAMASLGKVGSVAAVPALAPFRDRFLAFASPAAGAARDAILAIQGRAGHAQAGALALAEDGGGLALTESDER